MPGNQRVSAQGGYNTFWGNASQQMYDNGNGFNPNAPNQDISVINGENRFMGEFAQIYGNRGGVNPLPPPVVYPPPPPPGPYPVYPNPQVVIYPGTNPIPPVTVIYPRPY